MNLKNLNTDNMKKIAVLLTAFNRREKTLSCLDRLYSQIPVENVFVDVYLTNDGCTDGTPEAVKEQFPKVHIIDGDGTLFWNRGMWTAWNAASANEDYDYYMWLNDDTFSYPYMLKELVSLSEEKQDKAIIVGATEASAYSKPTYGGRNENGEIPIPDGSPVPIIYFNGNIVLIPRCVYNVLGNLDSYYTHSKGDFDYGLRAKNASIPMYQAGRYLGVCEAHPKLDKWCNPDVHFMQRLKMLYRPNGMPPKETFHFERRHKGFIIALFHFFTVHIRCMFPKVWARRIT